MDVVEGVGGLLAAAATVLFAFLPVLLALWVVGRLVTITRELRVLRTQLQALLTHTGVPAPPTPPRPRSRPWLLLVVLVVAFSVALGLFATAQRVPGEGLTCDQAGPQVEPCGEPLPHRGPGAGASPTQRRSTS